MEQSLQKQLYHLKFDLQFEATISDLTPRLVCTTSTFVFVTLKLPLWNEFVLGLPDHWSHPFVPFCHLGV